MIIYSEPKELYISIINIEDFIIVYDYNIRNVDYKGFSTYEKADNYRCWLECVLDRGGMCIVLFDFKFFVCCRDSIEKLMKG